MSLPLNIQAQSDSTQRPKAKNGEQIWGEEPPEQPPTEPVTPPDEPQVPEQPEEPTLPPEEPQEPEQPEEPTLPPEEPQEPEKPTEPEETEETKPLADITKRDAHNIAKSRLAKSESFVEQLPPLEPRAHFPFVLELPNGFNLEDRIQTSPACTKTEIPQDQEHFSLALKNLAQQFSARKKFQGFFHLQQNLETPGMAHAYDPYTHSTGTLVFKKASSPSQYEDGTITFQTMGVFEEENLPKSFLMFSEIRGHAKGLFKPVKMDTEEDQKLEGFSGLYETLKENDRPEFEFYFGMDEHADENELACHVLINLEGASLSIHDAIPLDIEALECLRTGAPMSSEHLAKIEQDMLQASLPKLPTSENAQTNALGCTNSSSHLGFWILLTLGLLWKSREGSFKNA